MNILRPKYEIQLISEPSFKFFTSYALLGRGWPDERAENITLTRYNMKRAGPHPTKLTGVSYYCLQYGTIKKKKSYYIY